MKVLNVAKAALYGMFLHYYCYYVIRGSYIPGGTVLFLAVALMCVGADMLKQRYVYPGKEVLCWIAYAVICLATTAWIARNDSDSDFIGDIIKFVQRVMVIVMVAYICEQERSVKFGLQLMGVTAVALAITVLMLTDDLQLKLSISTDANLSTNDTGAIVAFGCFAVLFGFGKRGKASMVLSAVKTLCVVSCVAVIFLAGSRKSIIAVLIMIAGLVLLCGRDYVGNLNVKKAAVLLIIGAAAYVLIGLFLFPYAEETSLYRRLFGNGAERAAASDESRIELYMYVIEEFLDHPLLGLGFNRYVLKYGNYTHSTYVEPLACSGLLGLIYLYPYCSITAKQVWLIRANEKGSRARLKQKEIFIYLCMFLFVAVGIPYMYKDAPCILLGTFIASQKLSLEELRETGKSSEEY